MFEEIRKVLDDIEWALTNAYSYSFDSQEGKRIMDIFENYHINFAKSLLHDSFFGIDGSVKIADVIKAIANINDLGIEIK